MQVKYEMLRDAEDSGRPIGVVTEEFGFSRTAYYNVKESFEKNGMSALIPEKTGPKKPHKLTGDLQEFVEEYVAEHPGASATGIAAAIRSEKGLSISKRTIERYSAKKNRCDTVLVNVSIPDSAREAYHDLIRSRIHTYGLDVFLKCGMLEWMLIIEKPSTERAFKGGAVERPGASARDRRLWTLWQKDARQVLHSRRRFEDSPLQLR